MNDASFDDIDVFTVDEGDASLSYEGAASDGNTPKEEEAFREAEPLETASHLATEFAEKYGNAESGANAGIQLFGLNMPENGSVGFQTDGYMPTTGDVKVLVLMVQFPDCPLDITSSQMEAYYDDYVAPYYEKESYGQLQLDADVTEVYTAAHERSYYENPDGQGEVYGRELLLREAIEHFDEQIDFSQYDSDGNGSIDGLYLRFAGDNAGYDSMWWSYVTTTYCGAISADGTDVGLFCWLHTDTPSTVEHETGHLLGLADYYDSSTGYGGYYGSYGLMYSGVGPLDAFSKLLLGWIDNPLIVTDGSEFSLHPLSEYPDAAIVYPDGDASSSQFFIVESDVSEDYTSVTSASTRGNYWEEYAEVNGFRVWRVNAELNSAGTAFAHGNSGTQVPLVSALSVGDAFEDMAVIGYGHANSSRYMPLLTAGDSYTPYTVPSTFIYADEATYFGPYEFTGISFEALSANSQGGSMRVSYEENPSNSAFDYAFQYDANSTFYAVFEFPQETYISDISKITLTRDADGSTVELSGWTYDKCWDSSHRLYLFTKEALANDGGTYTLSVPEGVFENSCGVENPRLDFTVQTKDGLAFSKYGASVGSSKISSVFEHGEDGFCYFLVTPGGMSMHVLGSDGSEESEHAILELEEDASSCYVAALKYGDCYIAVATLGGVSYFYLVAEDGESSLITETSEVYAVMGSLMGLGEGTIVVPGIHNGTPSSAYYEIDIATGEMSLLTNDGPSSFFDLGDGSFVTLSSASEVGPAAVKLLDGGMETQAELKDAESCFLSNEQLYEALRLDDGTIGVLSCVNPTSRSGSSIWLTVLSEDLGEVVSRRPLVGGTSFVGTPGLAYKLDGGYALTSYVSDVPTTWIGFSANLGRVYFFDESFNYVDSVLIHDYVVDTSSYVRITSVAVSSGLLCVSTDSAIFKFENLEVGSSGTPSLSIDPSAETLNVGDAVKLTVTPESSSDGLTWLSSDPSIAEVDSEGTVTAKAVGDAVITALRPDGMSASCAMKVATDISESELFALNGSYCGAAITPEVEVSFANGVRMPLRVGVDCDLEFYADEGGLESISPDEVVSVGTYYVRAIGKGSYSGETAIAPFVVDKGDPALKLTKSRVSLTPGGGYYYVYCSREGDGTMSVSSADVEVAVANLSGDAVSIEPQSAGVTTITVSVAESDSYMAASQTIHVTVSGDVMEAAMLYSDGALVFQWGNEIDDTHGELVSKYTGFEDDWYTSASLVPWYAERSLVKSVTFNDEISPCFSSYWFYEMSSCESIDLSRLDTSNVADMEYMFYGCSSLASLDLSPLDTSRTSNMSNMFSGCSSLESLDLSGFDTSSVTDMHGMFSGCSSLASIDLSSFDTSSVSGDPNSAWNSGMSNMFYRCSSLTSLDLSGFDTSNVANMSNMFYSCSSLTSLDLSSFDTSSVVGLGGSSFSSGMAYMFGNCSSLVALDISSFDVSNVVNMRGMFASCSSLAALDLTSFGASSVSDTSYMFLDCSSLERLDLSFFDASNVESMPFMFYGCTSLESVDLTGFDTSSATSMSFMFSNCHSLLSLDLSSFDTSNVTDMSSMFSYCYALKTLDISNFNTSMIVGNPDAEWSSGEAGFRSMFFDCSSLESLDLSSFDTSSATNMNGMFYGCSSLESLDLSSFDTSGVVDMGAMFGGCSSLSSLDLSEFDTSSATDMSAMFSGCSSLESLDLSGFDTSSVTDMNSMFSHCSSLTTLDLSSFDTSSVEGDPAVNASSGMAYMFCNCTSLVSLDLSSFDTSNVKNMLYLFYGCSSLESLNLSSFDTSSASDMDVMFDGCTSLETVSLGKNFNFAGDGTASCSLPTPYASFIEGASGYWYSLGTGAEYSAADVPSNTADTYSAVALSVDPSELSLLDLGGVASVEVVCRGSLVAAASSSDEGVVAVSCDDGVVSVAPVAAGSAYVTVSASGGEHGVTASLRVPVSVKVFTLSDPSVLVYNGEELVAGSGAEGATLSIAEKGGAIQFSAMLFDGDDQVDSDIAGRVLSWSVDDSSVAEVDEAGLLVARDNGAVTVSAEIDGTRIAGGQPVTVSFEVIVSGQRTPVAAPIAAEGLVYDGSEQAGVAPGEGYSVEGGAATRAGDYVAVATLAEGYCWPDGSVEAAEVPWSIARAALTATYAGEAVAWGEEPALAVGVEGFVGGEGAETAAGYVAPAVSLPEAVEPGKSYVLAPAGGEADDYEFEYVPGTLSVGEAGVTPPEVDTQGRWISGWNGWWFEHADGTWAANGWEFIDGSWYLFDADGWMLTGWQKWAGSWYYLQPSGVLYSGWLSWGGAWYYLDPENDSAMATGWFQDETDAWYYADASGAMQTGWLNDGGAWYYLQPSGAMLTGWLSWGGEWYFLGESGAMATGWFQDETETWYYADASGAMAHDCWVGDYYLTGSGAMATSQWVGPYWVGADGKWVPSA